MKHKKHMDGHMGHEPAHMYRNEEEEPMVPKGGHQMPGMVCCDFKGEAAEIAYGQASVSGTRSDEKKIHSQFKNYGWDGGASNY